jgi:hypothetical protein
MGWFPLVAPGRRWLSSDILYDRVWRAGWGVRGFGEEWEKLGTFGKIVFGSAFSAGNGELVLDEEGARARAAVGSFCNGAKKVRRALIGEGFVPSILRAVVGGKRAGWRECCVDLRGGRFAGMRSIDVAELLMSWHMNTIGANNLRWRRGWVGCGKCLVSGG